MWVIQCNGKQLHSWVSWVIETQVQLSQVGGLGVQSQSQKRTAFLCNMTTWQPAKIKLLVSLTPQLINHFDWATSTVILRGWPSGSAHFLPWQSGTLYRSAYQFYASTFFAKFDCQQYNGQSGSNSKLIRNLLCYFGFITTILVVLRTNSSRK